MKKNKVLWVDDDIDFALYSFMDELEESDYRVIRAQNPDVAWQQLEDNDIDAIIMDIMMPTGELLKSETSQKGMYTGLKLLEKIKQEPQYAKIPALIFTILNKDQEVEDWAQREKVEILRKLQIYPEDLVEAIDKLVKRKEDIKS